MVSREVKAVGWFLLAYVVFNVLLYGLFLLWGEQLAVWLTDWSSVMQLVIFFLLQEAILLFLLGVIWKRIVGENSISLFHTLAERRQRKGWGGVRTYVVGGLLLYFVANALLLGLLSALGREIPGLYGEQMVMSLLEGLHLQLWREYLLVASIVVLIGPLVEELIFRGIITHSFMQEWAWKGVVLAALVFAAIHGERAVVWNLVMLSLFLGYIYWKTGSMWYSFLFHVGINGLAMLVLILSQLYPEIMMG